VGKKKISERGTTTTPENSIKEFGKPNDRVRIVSIQKFERATLGGVRGNGEKKVEARGGGWHKKKKTGCA